ncbi:MAG: hypothetical protein LBK97_08270 [Prevotellaceae bacterium]|nr:hypothetical protein [Prevotellaceae bacterium]
MSNKIEIRKQKNQFVIGRIPSWIIRWGNAVILVVCMILLYMSFNLKFPVTVSGQVEITNDSIYIVIPGIKHDLVREGQEINLRMDDYPYMDYGILRGKISSLSDIEYKDNSIRASAFLLNDLNRIKRQDLIPGMHGVGDIIVDRTPIIYRILKTN